MLSVFLNSSATLTWVYFQYLPQKKEKKLNELSLIIAAKSHRKSRQAAHESCMLLHSAQGQSDGSTKADKITAEKLSGGFHSSEVVKETRSISQPLLTDSESEKLPQHGAAAEDAPQST